MVFMIVEPLPMQPFSAPMRCAAFFKAVSKRLRPTDDPFVEVVAGYCRIRRYMGQNALIE